LWQVLAIYLAASWGVIQTVDSLASLLDLPSWAPRFALFLMIIGLPIVLATAFVQEGVRFPEGSGGARNDAEVGTTGTTSSPANRLFTWRNALLGGGLAFALLGGGDGARSRTRSKAGQTNRRFALRERRYCGG
jgi:hypothetical protein